MTKEQIDELQKVLIRYKANDYEKMILAHFAGQGHPDTVIVHENITVSVFIRLFNRLFQSIEAGLAQDAFWTVDSYLILHEQRFHDILYACLDSVGEKSFRQAVLNLLKALALIQRNGLFAFYTAAAKNQQESEIDYSQLDEQIRIAIKTVEEADAGLRTKWEDILKKQDYLNIVIREAERKVDVLEQFLVNGQQNANTIKKLDDETNHLKNDIEKKLVEINTRNETSEKLAESLEAIKAELKENQAAIASQQKLYEEFLKTVEERKAFFDSRNKELEELIGREVGANLFATFDKRKKELNKPVRNWAWAVIGALAVSLTGIWLIFHFTFLELGQNNFDLWMLFITSIKSAPLIMVLFFVIRQYGRERKFQEEYAFKSAVALTINAYAENLQEDANHDTLIMRGVQEIYRSPISEKPTGRMKEKQLKDIVAEVLEGVKKVKE